MLIIGAARDHRNYVKSADTVGRGSPIGTRALDASKFDGWPRRQRPSMGAVEGRRNRVITATYVHRFIDVSASVRPARSQGPEFAKPEVGKTEPLLT